MPRPSAGLRVLGLAGAALALMTACASPPPVNSIERPERLDVFPTEGLPLQGAAEIRWNEFQVPYILADKDEDVALLLGMVHGHLRRTQMDVLRRIAAGRLSETAGPFANEIDTALRCLKIREASEASVALLPPESLAWVERYVEGINLYSELHPVRPHDAGLLNIDISEPWTPVDVFCVARLASVDLNWTRPFQKVDMGDAARGEEFLERIERYDSLATPSFGGDDPTPLEQLLRIGKTGSNCWVVSGERSESGSAMIASDPHLGFLMPNLWCLVAWKSETSQVVGMTLPGVPAVTLGRNPDIAWGGTNMAGNSSVFYDVSDLPESAFRSRTFPIKTRVWFDGEGTIRETDWGPVVTDSPALKGLGWDESQPVLTLDWRGQRPSDEITPFLKAGRASSWGEFREAFSSYAVAGQNMLYADAEGNIGQLMALDYDPVAGAAYIAGGVLKAGDTPPAHVTIPSTELPSAYNPADGYLVSANNTPIKTDPPLSAFSNNNDRVDRIRQMIESQKRWDAEGLKAMQRDVYSTSNHLLAQRMVAMVDGDPGLAEGVAIVKVLADWDGEYRIDSRGAVVFQRVLDQLLKGFYKDTWGKKVASYMRRSTATATWMVEDIESGDLDKSTLVAAMLGAVPGWDQQQVWGDIHRLSLSHPLAFAPVIGADYKVEDVPIPGSFTTVHKSAHQVDTKRHFAFFGSQSRHVSDMADPDANWFVLLGGQDGVIGSVNFADMAGMWATGEMVQMPLTQRAIEREFPISMPLVGAR